MNLIKKVLLTIVFLPLSCFAYQQYSTQQFVTANPTSTQTKQQTTQRPQLEKQERASGAPSIYVTPKKVPQNNAQKINPYQYQSPKNYAQQGKPPAAGGPKQFSPDGVNPPPNQPAPKGVQPPPANQFQLKQRPYPPRPQPGPAPAPQQPNAQTPPPPPPGPQGQAPGANPPPPQGPAPKAQPQPAPRPLPAQEAAAKSEQKQANYDSSAKKAWFRSCLSAVSNKRVSPYAQEFCNCGWQHISGGQLPPGMLTSTNKNVIQKRGRILSAISQECMVQVMAKHHLG